MLLLFKKVCSFIDHNRYYIVLFFLAFFNLFFFLDKLPVFSWDEARHGISAYEMIKSKNYISHTYFISNGLLEFKAASWVLVYCISL